MVSKHFMLSLLIAAALAYSSVRAVTDTLINAVSTSKSDGQATEVPGLFF